MNSIILLAAFTAVLFYVYQLSENVTLGLISLLGVELLNFTFGTSQGLFGEIHLDPLDFISICLLLAGCVRTARSMDKLYASRLIALAYIALLAASIARGLMAYDMKSIANEGRGLVPSLIGMLYFLTAPTDDKSMRRYTWIYLYFGMALCVVAMLATAGLDVGATAWAHVASLSDEGLNGRALPASGAAAIASCVFLSLGILRVSPRTLLTKLMPAIFLVFAVYLRHRTVWMMLIAGIVTLAFIDKRLSRRLVPALAVGAALFVGLIVFGQSFQAGVGLDQFSESTSNEGTLQWRLTGWKDLVLDDEQTLQTVTIGKSFGTGFHRLDAMSGHSIDVAPHNEYITRYLRVGLLGATCVAFFVLRPFTRLWAIGRLDKTAIYPSVSAWTVVVLMIAVFGLAYSIDFHSFALLGICNALISNPQSIRAGSDAEVAPWPRVAMLRSQTASAGSSAHHQPHS